MKTYRWMFVLGMIGLLWTAVGHGQDGGSGVASGPDRDAAAAAGPLAPPVSAGAGAVGQASVDPGAGGMAGESPTDPAAGGAGADAARGPVAASPGGAPREVSSAEVSAPTEASRTDGVPGPAGPLPVARGFPSPAPTTAPDQASGPLRVQVGLYVLDLARLDMKENQFYADFYIWYKWPDRADRPWTPADIEFMNGTVEAATPLATDTLAGVKYASQRIKGTFRGKFNLRSYPFDSQRLPIVFEDQGLNADKLRFEADPNNPDQNRWIEAGVQVPDWKVAGARVFTDLHLYDTDFGDSVTSPATQTQYHRFHFETRLDRLFVPHFIKFIIPLLVIAGMAYMVFFINAREFEAQCGICVTALLTAVALHISQADALPAVGYLVLSDKIFIIFYLFIFSALVQTVVANNHAKRGRIRSAMALDALFQWAYPLGILLGCAVAMAF